MLYIVMESGKKYGLHIGENKPVVAALEVVEIQAEGDELDHIKKTFTNIPLSDKPIQSWFGDLAKTIYRSL